MMQPALRGWSGSSGDSRSRSSRVSCCRHWVGVDRGCVYGRVIGDHEEVWVEPELVALATSAATTMVNAMATDTWQSIRVRLAQLLGRGETRSEQMALETLDEDAETLSGEPTAMVRREVTAAWTIRLRDLLRSDPKVAAGLRELVAEVDASTGAASASGHGVAVGRDMTIRASYGGTAAGVIHGSVSPSNPT
jgi:hypothetical protein